MRRILFLILLTAGLAATASAQYIGKRVSVRAGTPEDKALSEIAAQTDPAKKLELLQKFLAEFGQGELALAAYDALLNFYAEQKQYEQAYESGETLLQLDPDNFSTASTLVRLAQEQGNLERLFRYGELAGQIVQRYRASPAPEGVSPEDWQRRKDDTLAALGEQIRYNEYVLFNAAYQLQNPEQKAALLERFVKAFPDSTYAAAAQSLVATSYQQAQKYDKMLEFANSILAREPNNLGMLLLLADYLSEKGEQLDKAEANARKALEVLSGLQKPEQVTEEQWTRQKSLQQGLARSALGQVLVHQKKLPQAVEEFRAASPLLQPDPVTYGRNLYRLGFTLALMKNNAEARRVLTEAVNVESPYKALAQETLAKLGPAPAAKKRR
jgi:tetratricopeptide (TPR) repeat protein